MAEGEPEDAMVVEGRVAVVHRLLKFHSEIPSSNGCTTYIAGADVAADEPLGVELLPLHTTMTTHQRTHRTVTVRPSSLPPLEPSSSLLTSIRKLK